MKTHAAQQRARRYAWDLTGYLRAGGTLEQLFEAFQDNYAPLLRDPQRAERRAVSATGVGPMFCKAR
jgi:hypothetical protein